MSRTSRAVALGLSVVALAALGAPACGRGADKRASGRPEGADGLVLPSEATSAGPTRKADRKAKAAERVAIPAGKLTAGSTPGDDGRDPLLEPVLLPVDLGAFEIDKLPYPNDPSQPPRTQVTRDEARALCKERGQRLCTELEWERACKGDDGELYAAGNRWDPQCAKDPASCASGFGVLAMGGALREWTDSDLSMPGEERRRAVLRGATATADGVDHRCAKRTPIDATAKGPDTGFRCCKGPENAAQLPPSRVGEPQLSKTQVDLKAIQRQLSSIPELAPYIKDLALFPEEDAIKTVLARGDAGVKPGPLLTTSPVLWSPVPTEEVLVLALRAKSASLIVALYKLPEGKLRLASSLVLKDEPGPVVLSYTSFNKKRVGWSTCWECSGESGAVELRDGKRIVINHL